MFDHVALGIELPGPLTPKERKARGNFKHQRNLWRWTTGHDATNNQYGFGVLDPAFDDPPSFSWMQPEMPQTWGPDQ